MAYLLGFILFERIEFNTVPSHGIETQFRASLLCKCPQQNIKYATGNIVSTFCN